MITTAKRPPDGGLALALSGGSGTALRSCGMQKAAGRPPFEGHAGDY
ncbi:hypothetical protein [Paenibacillus azoreducens]|nr:hypothetical protein [Paenibacillus azoreducens]